MAGLVWGAVSGASSRAGILLLGSLVISSRGLLDHNVAGRPASMALTLALLLLRLLLLCVCVSVYLAACLSGSAGDNLQLPASLGLCASRLLSSLCVAAAAAAAAAVVCVCVDLAASVFSSAGDDYLPPALPSLCPEVPCGHPVRGTPGRHIRNCHQVRSDSFSCFFLSTQGFLEHTSVS